MRACNCARASPFQSRTCEGCDPQLSIRQTMRISFNPCIRVGCDFRTRGEDGTSVPVSIHAPAWGATPSSMALMASATVFQSTHPRGVRPRPFCASCICCWFQSTHPRGVRLILELLPFQLFIVSIHAPAWGATKRALQLFFKRLRFQSTHPRGVRQGSTSGFPNGGKFQSTHPRGVRHDLRAIEDLRHAVSIHAPAWGATYRAVETLLQIRVSIHAPAWGAT